MKRYLILLMTVFALTLFITGCGETDSSYISIVQNGYLGEYTDITVKDLLSGHYSLLYDKEVWDGGTTDSGKEIVEVKYQDSEETLDEVAIQFTMLDEQCFQVTAFVDPMNIVSIEKPTDLFAALNYIYFEQYTLQHQDIVGDFYAELALIQRLEQISGSAVSYGASADYSGNRGEVCNLDNKSSLEVNVPLLLDHYGLLDLSYYCSDSNELASDSSIDSLPVPNTTKSDIIIETNYYTLTLPASWDGRYICERQDNNLTFYELENYNDGWGGMLFNISLQGDDEFLEFPGFYSLGSLLEWPDDGISPIFLYYVAVSTPTDVQFSEDSVAAYSEMSDAIDSILASFTAKDGYALITD